jgi:hypothetical protein
MDGAVEWVFRHLIKRHLIRCRFEMSNKEQPGIFVSIEKIDSVVPRSNSGSANNNNNNDQNALQQFKLPNPPSSTSKRGHSRSRSLSVSSSTNARNQVVQDIVNTPSSLLAPSSISEHSVISTPLETNGKGDDASSSMFSPYRFNSSPRPKSLDGTNLIDFDTTFDEL